MFQVFKQKNSIYDDSIWFEKISFKQLDRLLKSNLLKPYDKKWIQQTKAIHTNDKDHLLNIRKKLKNGVLSVSYQGAGMGLGRVYPKGSLSLGQLSKPIRHTLCKDCDGNETMVDIDLENAHANIAFQTYLKIKGEELPMMKKYITERDSIFEEYVKLYFGITKEDKTYNDRRGDIKILFIIYFYLGSFSTWNNGEVANLILPNSKETQFLKEYRAELIKFGREIYNDNPIIRKAVKVKKRIISKNATEEEVALNINMNNRLLYSSVMSHFFGEFERRVIEEAISFLKKKKIIEKNYVINCFDGFMMRICDYEKWIVKYPENDLLETLSLRIKKKLGFQLKFTYKSFNSDLNRQLDDIDTALDNITHPSKYLNKLNVDYMNDLDNYEYKKNYFENFIFYIRSLDQYIINEIYEDNKINILTKKKEINRRRNIKIYKRTEIKNMFENIESGEYTQRNQIIYFTDKWFKDPQKKTYLRMEFLPYNDIYREEYENTETFNTFTGYNELIKTEYNRLNKEKIIRPFKDRLFNLCGKNENCMNLFLHIVAHKIQFPKVKLPYAFIFTSQEGEGKNVILDCIKRIIGTHHFISSSNMEDFVGTYAEGFSHKLVVNLNEIGASDSRQAERKMKSLISEDKLRVNAKYLRPTDENNFALIIITTNEENPIKLDIAKGERRWIINRGNGLNRKLKASQWIKHIKHFENPQFISCLYDYFNELDGGIDEDGNRIDIMDYDFKGIRELTKQTDGYKKMCENFIPLTALWLNDFILQARYINYRHTIFIYCTDSDADCNDELVPCDSMVEESNIPLNERSYFNKEYQVKGVKMFKDYTEWSKNNKFIYETNARSFYSKLNALNMPIEIKNIHNVKHLIFKPREVYVKMIANSWFSRDEKYDSWLNDELEECNKGIELEDDYFDL